MKAIRSQSNPLIHQGLDEEIGDNINGASLIKVPDWVSNRLAQYYLYFAHHKGRHIRMAYANDLNGPWQIYRSKEGKPGVLNVSETQFVTKDIKTPATGGGDWVKATGGQFLYAHIASPDVHIVEKDKQILMYYHGLLEDGEQKTRLAISDDGLHFTSLEPLLGTPYFRVFAYGDYIYAIAWGGALFRAKSWQGPFEKGPDILNNSDLLKPEQTIRHVAVRRCGETLELFYSCIGDNPESIYRATISLNENWQNWQVNEPLLLLKPEYDYEGADLPDKTSQIGAAPGPEKGLRDPCIFENYLLYSGAAESNVCLAKLVPQVKGEDK